MSNGFGFSFNSDDDDENNRNNPFGFNFGGTGGGGLGEMLNQFGAMLSGMGSSMNSPEGSGPVDYDMAGHVGPQQLGSEKGITQDDPPAVEQSVGLPDSG